MGGLSLKFKTEACSAEVFNFNEKPTMRFLCCLYLGTGHKVKGGGGGGENHMFGVCTFGSPSLNICTKIVAHP
jgi:hypothetical protein